jgi:phage shock protein E
MKITKRLIWLARQFDFFTDGFSFVQPRVRLWERYQSSSAEKSPKVDRQDAFLRLANDARSRVTEITPMELAKKRLRPLIIDVREEKEFLTGHIGGAKHISRRLLEERIGHVASDLTTQILVYCARGDRGALAADSLQKMGYLSVYSLKGGLQHWFEAGGVVECAESRRRTGPEISRATCIKTLFAEPGGDQDCLVLDLHDRSPSNILEMNCGQYARGGWNSLREQ